jgi:hypothetical protein
VAPEREGEPKLGGAASEGVEPIKSLRTRETLLELREPEGGVSFTIRGERVGVKLHKREEKKKCKICKDGGAGEVKLPLYPEGPGVPTPWFQNQHWAPGEPRLFALSATNSWSWEIYPPLARTRMSQ